MHGKRGQAGQRPDHVRKSRDSLAFMIAREDNCFKSTTHTSQGDFGDTGRLAGAGVDPTGLPSACKGFLGWMVTGGSLSYSSPEKQVAVSYTMTGMFDNGLGPRTSNLMHAVARTTSQ